MQPSIDRIRFKRKSVINFIVASLVIAVVTPVLADYLGPDRTVTQTTSVCKIVLYECQYIPSKDVWKYHKVDDWSCSNEGKPWQAYPSSPSSMGCFERPNASEDQYWQEEEVLNEITITHPPATITDSLQNCNINKGWCNTTPELALSANEPLSGYQILAIEGLLNGQTFVCSGANCSVPLNEGDNNLTFWALSSWGDSSEMDTFSARVDTIPPTLGLDISASNGTNSWYVSQTSVTATASDSTSGLSSVLLSVNNGSWEPSATLSEGVHSVDVQAEDNAGNTSNTSTTISVDITTPAIDLVLSGTPGNNGWYISTMEINASAADATSGIQTFEASSDGGAYADYAFPMTFSDGYHTLQVKATDFAGNQTETALQEFYIDTIAPTIEIPVSWNVGELITYTVQDNGSGLASLSVVIEDEDGQYAKVARNENVSGANFNGEINWDGTFADGTVASSGEYLVWIMSNDMAGNQTYMLGIVTVPSPLSPSQSNPTELPSISTFTPPDELFNDGLVFVERASLSSVSYGGSTAQTMEAETTTFSIVSKASSGVVSTNSNILWGAVAAAVVGMATSYALDEKRKRDDEEAQQKAQVKAQVEARNEALRASQEAKWEAQKVENWLQGQNILNAHIEMAKTQGATDQQISTLKETASKQGLDAAIGGAVKLSQNLYNAAVHDARLEVKMSRYQVEDETQFQVMQLVAQQKEEDARKLAESQAVLAAYYSARRQEEKEENASMETNWWEQTKSFVGDSVFQPVNQYVIQPFVRPILKDVGDAVTNGASWVNENLYQPYIKPQIDHRLELISSTISWVDENLYQPHIKPEIDKTLEAAVYSISWVNGNLYQPYVKPYIEQTAEEFKNEITRINESFYQPIVKPAIQQGIEWVTEHIYQPIIQPVASMINENFVQPIVLPALEQLEDNLKSVVTWVDENIYQPIFAPVVNDINKYIYQPLTNVAGKAWDKYGEWVHGSLDAVGFIPGLGEIADGLNGLIYLGEGRYIEAGISALAMLPILGDLGKAGKWTLKAGTEVLEEAAEKVAKEVVEEVIEKVARETAEEVSEIALKETAEEIIEKTTKEIIEQVSEKTIKETSEVLISKVTKESLEGAAEKVVKETSEALLEKTSRSVADNFSEKVIKDASEVITSASIEKVSKTTKAKLVEQGLEKAEDKTVDLIISVADKLGDDIDSINKAVALIQKHGDDAVKALEAVSPEVAAKVLQAVDGNILDDVIKQGTDAFAAFSGWAEKELKDHGKELAERATKDAEVLKDVETLVSIGPIDPNNLTNEQKVLIEKIAANSTFNVDGNKIVVGKWAGLDDGFLLRARETRSIHYGPHPDLWPLFKGLENQGEAAWLINKQVIQSGIEKGLPFEYTLSGIKPDNLVNEANAIEAIWNNATNEEIMDVLKLDYVPVRMQELIELHNAGFEKSFDTITNSFTLNKS